MVKILTTECTDDTEVRRQSEFLLRVVSMAEQYLRVHKLPGDVREDALAGGCVVVIDLLRATSTICQALASGAREVVPFLEIDEAVAAANAAGRADIVLGGERSGGKIPGFDVGNSPAEYAPDVVGGKRVFITTTNGTRAMHHARRASRIVLGCFLNLSAMVESIKNEPRINILCAGTDGQETGEDILAAGSVAHTLMIAPCGEGMSDERPINETAVMAATAWKSLEVKAQHEGRPVHEELVLALRETAGGRNLIGIGLDRDIVDCAQIDRLSVVPEVDLSTWRITSVPS
jgi:2-phosphosulfolactate phosphatase